MPITAKMSFRFLWRLGLIAIICLGGCLYCLYDGAVAYPKQHDRAVAYKELKEEVKKQDLKGNEFFERWEKLANERGWPLKEPKDDVDIAIQFVFAAVLVVPGLPYLYFFLSSLRRWIELNETGLRTSWGRQFKFDQIVTLNKKKWKTKGIAKIIYEENGRRRRLALDDWKYDVDATKAILREVESRINVQQIVGGPPEPPPEEKQPEEPRAERQDEPREVDSSADHEPA